MMRKIGAIAASAVLAGLIILCQAGCIALRKGIDDGMETSGDAAAREGWMVIIDAGHGGVDAGKVGVNGEEEKDINLNISLKIKKLLEEQGVKVKMTRNDDDRLAESQIEDLKARVSIMNKEKPDLVVSIHQNSYHEETVRGAQVFYYTDSRDGEEAAGYIQKALSALDPESAKERKANNTYYLLKKTEVPVVIVECGFLSNWEDCAKLQDENYQDKLVWAIHMGVLKYMNGA